MGEFHLVKCDWRKGFVAGGEHISGGDTVRSESDACVATVEPPLIEATGGFRFCLFEAYVFPKLVKWV